MPFRERNVAAARAFVAVAVVFGKAYAPAIAHRASIRLGLWFRLDTFLAGGTRRLAFRNADERLLFFFFDFKIDFGFFSLADDPVLEHVVADQSAFAVIFRLFKFRNVWHCPPDALSAPGNSPCIFSAG